MSRFRFVDAEKARLPISMLCKTVGVSKSGYYAWKGRPPSRRSRDDAALTEKIREVHHRSRETYGYPRVHAELRTLGVRCGRRRVARLMRRAGIRGCVRGKKRRTTRRDPRAIPAPDLVNRDFRAAGPDRLWTADITYLRTGEGFLHLAFVLDVYSRKIVGWAMGLPTCAPSSSSTLRRWPCGGGSLKQVSSTTPTGAPSTRRSPSARDSKRPG
ncbi:MAG: Mobile element protein [uncultured Rubrobacteraceae bacterium]|uniref:Mobile element protein n=1 Tax=uncultured Rubrobacteraceae bacterium TaxID=349277 RepID=A0A6J4NTM8_9ACTN|nr:MAG: Mobile element protein [uncultured Rubrobacteraceae bacterium]